VSRLVAAARKAGDDDPRKARAMQAGGHLAADLGVVQRPGPEDVVWVEGPPHAPVLRMAPVDVGERLAECLWPKVTAVLTSATIPPHMAHRLAIPNCVTLDVGSPFAHREQALLYCAAHLPDPRRPTFQDAAQQELVSLINAAGGRTLALFTSWKAMESAAIFARENVAYRVLTQSDMPKPALLSAFTADETSCLFATMGFWQGVDVAGSTLSLVVIDKIPFPRPNEPLHQARRNRAGPNAFQLVDIPRAATLLAQGVGRLIRTANDRGVVAVLDPRLATAGYRRDILNALPPMRRTINPADVAAFLAAGAS
jgi:ATP-dependent DNA helicase DinG